MKLVYPDYRFQIYFEESIVNVLVIENEKEFTHLIREIVQQINGYDGRFVLSEEDKILKVTNTIQCIIDPFNLEINSKKVLDRIYEKSKQDIMDTDLYLSQENMNLIINEFMNRVLEQSDYSLVYQDRFDVKNIFKLVDLKIMKETCNLLEEIIDYLKVNSKLLNYDVFIFVNLKSYLSHEELTLFYKTIAYEKYKILLVENGLKESNRIECEKCFIIDKDCCEIY